MLMKAPAPQEPAVGDQIGYSVYTEHGWADLIAVDRALTGKHTKLTRADREYIFAQYGISEARLRQLRWPSGYVAQRADEPARESGKYVQVARDAIANPGQWIDMVYRDTRSGAANIANTIRQGRYAQFRPRGSFEARARGGWVQVRYVGG